MGAKSHTATARFILGLLIFLGLFVPGDGLAQSEPVRLFQATDTLSLELLLPLEELLDDRREESSEFRQGRLSWSDGGKSVPVAVRATGHNRMDVCSAPPLQFRFEAKDVAGTLFDQQQILFVTTHCKRSEIYEQYLLSEYLSYAAFNSLTPLSYRVRLARIHYRDLASDKDIERLAFFIEHPRLMAARNGQQTIELAKVERDRLEPKQGALVGLYQLLVGNTDWSMLAGRPGSKCCHNVQLITGPSGLVFPVPYDFDSSGMVNARYAVPNERLGQRSVRTRRYRGLCEFNSQLPEAASLFSTHRDEIEALFRNQPEVSASRLKSSLSYIEDFYQVLDHPKKFRKSITERCH